VSTRDRALVTIVVAGAFAFALAWQPGVAAAADPVPPPKTTADPLVPYPPPSPRVVAPPEQAFTYARPQGYPSLPWMALQLVPSPELVVGRVRETSTSGASELSTKTAFGLRWQLTPLLYSWGTNRHASRWRFLVVDPLARHSGSIEVPLNLEYVFGHVDRFIARPGVRAYFPLVERGEYLSTSIGTSTYSYDDKMRVAYDVGLYVLYGIFGIQATIAPDNGPMMATGTFRIRYF
jgi:hypothetical protein